MNIGIVGAGGLGGTLARRLSELGHDVSIANSRGPDSLSAFAAEIGAAPVSVVEAGEAADVVILSIPTTAVPNLPPGLLANVDDGAVVVVVDMLDSEWVSHQLGRPVIKAFNSIFAGSLLEKGTPAGTDGRIALPVAGDPPDARATVLSLVDELGFDPVDGGGLDDSWRQQPGTPAYCQDLDAAALRGALAAADRTRIAEYLASEEVRIRRAIAAAEPRS